MNISLKIDVLCNDGSPLEVTYKTIWGDEVQVGVGGAELALLTLCEMWTNAGHNVVLYNNPREANASVFEQRKIESFNPSDNRDILIIFRSPNIRAVPAKGEKIWLSCDQYTQGNFKDFAPQADKIICISKYHQQYFHDFYKISNTDIIDLPIRVSDYDGLNIEKIPNRLLFTSIAERGLMNLLNIWDTMKSIIPSLSLVITSDYRLWGRYNGAMNEQHRVKWMNKNGVTFLGAIPRKQLIEEELKADILAYPSIYPELFCISCAEAQYAGVYPVTSGIGALSTTNMGTIVQGNANEAGFLEKFSHTIIDLLSDRCKLIKLQQETKNKALERFHPNIILEKWNKLFEETLNNGIDR